MSKAIMAESQIDAISLNDRLENIAGILLGPAAARSPRPNDGA